MALFQQSGKQHVWKETVKIFLRGSERAMAIFFRKILGMLSNDEALLLLRLDRILKISKAENSKERQDVEPVLVSKKCPDRLVWFEAW